MNECYCEHKRTTHVHVTAWPIDGRGQRLGTTPRKTVCVGYSPASFETVYPDVYPAEERTVEVIPTYR